MQSPSPLRLAGSAIFPLIIMLNGCSAHTAASTAAIPALPGQVIDVRATEFSFDAPETIPAGLTTFRLEQTGLVVERIRAGMQGQALVSDQGDNSRGLHMLWVVRLDDGKMITDLLDAARAKLPTPWAHIVGGPGFILPPRTTNATMVLEAGNYALVCYVGSGRANETRYHLLHGMVRTLVVAPSSNSTTLPTAHTIARVTAPGVVEFSKPLQSGSQLIRVDNKTARDIEFTFLQKGGIGFGGLSSVPSGATVMTTIVFVPGEYSVRTGFGAQHVPIAFTIAN